jgi:hypothetical protein
VDRVVKAVVVGAGSIGRRHVSALLARPDVESVTVVTAWPGASSALAADRRLTYTTPGTPVDADVAFVAVDTDRHIAAATPLVQAGIDTLVEKPISHRREDVDALAAAANESGALVCVGYNLRFLPAVAELRDLVASGALGRLLFARFEAGQYLPAWRPDRDYRETYSAFRTRGGGVGLDLSHELDVMRFVLGDPASWRVAARHVSNLDIDSDDLFEGCYDYVGGAVSTVHLDYLSPRLVRAYRVVGEKGESFVDIAKAFSTVTTQANVHTSDDPDSFDVAATYPAQLDAFLSQREGVSTPIATLAEGVRVLELLEDSNAK